MNIFEILARRRRCRELIDVVDRAPCFHHRSVLHYFYLGRENAKHELQGDLGTCPRYHYGWGVS